MGEAVTYLRVAVAKFEEGKGFVSVLGGAYKANFDKIEKKLQETPYLDRISSYSRAGESTVMFFAKDSTPPAQVMAQLGELLSRHQQTIIRLFQDWDEDGNGGIGREEFRKALAGLGYTADKKAVNQIFDQLQAETSTALHASDMGA